MDYVPVMYATFWALVPPVVAIVLALITKEVYSSLFLGILVGGLFYSGFSFEGTVLHIFEDGIVGVLSDSYNVGILVFLVILVQVVQLIFNWLSRRIDKRLDQPSGAKKSGPLDLLARFAHTK